MRSENHFRILDLCAGSFGIATLNQFYDFLKLDRLGGLASHVIRRTADVYWWGGSMQKSIETLY